MDTPQLLEIVTQLVVNVVELGVIVLHLERTARRLAEKLRDENT
jgi:hypothetical protein